MSNRDRIKKNWIPVTLALLLAMAVPAIAGVVEIGYTPGAADTVAYSTGSALAFRTSTAQADAAFGSTQGSILYRNATVWTVLTPGTNGQALLSGGAAANPSWGAPAVTAHNLLSTSHGDTAAASPVRGDLLVGNATPAWTKLATGAAGTVLAGGTDPAYTANPSLTSLTLTTALARAEGGTGVDAATTDGQVLIGSTSGGNWTAANITGTANRVTVTNGSGTITLNGPQDLHTTASPTFTAVIASLRQSSKTAAYTVLTTDVGTVFDNQGTTASVVLTLPTPAAGMFFTGIVKDADGLQFTAGASTTIRIGGSVSAAAGNIVSTAIGSTVTLVGLSTTEWYAISSLGNWTVN